jgi:hypothetical protein
MMVGTGLCAPAGAAASARTTPAKDRAPRLEVLFVLDTTGSMGGLIEGAKLKIWSIANQLIAAKPAPKLRLGLIGYRDRGDDYVTQFYDLSEDIDAVYANLQRFQAGGGGDGPESVNQALHEAVTRPTWSADREVLKIVFLVGDAPPHMDYAADVKFPQSCQAAVRRDLIINTVQCGAWDETARVWQEIARLGEGTFVAIGQTGDMQALSTPVDAELAELNRALGRTIVAYGGTAARREAEARQARSEAAAPSVAAERLAFKTAARGVAAGMVGAVEGGGDLVDDERDGRVKLAEMKKDALPSEMQAMSSGEQSAYLGKKRSERQRLQAQIAALVKKRQAHVDAELRRAAAARQGDAFDLKVAEAVRRQAARKGIRYGTESATPTPPSK